MSNRSIRLLYGLIISFTFFGMALAMLVRPSGLVSYMDVFGLTPPAWALFLTVSGGANLIIGVRGDDFVNAVAQFRWQRSLADLTELVANIHGQAGRSPTERAAEGRTLDLDLELFGQAVDGPNRLPRKDVLAYDFVLAPLAELSPELPHPVLGSTMAALWAPRAGSTLLRCLGDYVQH